MATRFYLPSSGAAAVSPSYSASWEDTSSAIRLKCVTTKISSAMTSDSFTDTDSSDRDILHVQYVSDPIAAQTISAQTVKFQIRGTETRSGNNLYTSWRVYVVSNDGSTERGTVIAHRRDGSELTNTLTNRGDSATSTSVSASANDRIVIEVGRGGDPSAASDNHSGVISIGDDSATDLPEDSTTTAANNPWVEFANTITFASGGLSQSASGGITPAGALTRAIQRAISAALAPAGAMAKRTGRALSGGIGPAGSLSGETGTITTLTDGYGGDQDTATDVLINSLNTDWCGDPHNSFEIIGGGQIQKGLIRWDLSAIAAGAGCVSAKVTFTKNDAASGSYTPTVVFYEISAANGDWGDGGATITDPAGAGEPTWAGKEADGSGGVTTAWAGSAGLSTAGTDYVNALVGSVVGGSGDAAGTEYEVTLNPAVVQGWFGEATNPGLVFWGDAPGGHWGQSSEPTTGYRPVLVVVYFEADAGGTAYTRSVSGALAPAGQVAKRTARSLSGALAPVGAMVKRLARALAGGISPAGTLSTLRVFLRSLAGGLTPAGQLTRRAGKALGGAIAPAGLMVMRLARALAGGISPSGALSTLRVFLRSLAGGLTPAGQLTRRAGKALGGAIAPAGGLVRRTARRLSGAVVPAGVLSAGRRFVRALAGTLASAGTVVRRTQRRLDGQVTPAGGLAKLIRRALAGALGLAGDAVGALLELGSSWTISGGHGSTSGSISGGNGNGSWTGGDGEEPVEGVIVGTVVNGEWRVE